MKYIFLDVDGVLNNKKHYSKQHKKYGGRFFCEDMPFNPKSLVNLKKIIKKTGAKIVLSSSWRRTTNGMIVLKARLMEYGIKIHSTTPHIDGYMGKEIKKWCEDNIKAEDRILIIDDEMYDIKEFFKTNEIVKINYNNGLNSIKKYESIKKLNRKEKKVWMKQ